MSRSSSQEVAIQSRDYWEKILDNHQTNWAIVEDGPVGTTVFFMHELSGVFDRLAFPGRAKAETALHANGFRRPKVQAGWSQAIPLGAPRPPFYEDSHPNGPIYSSGRYWRLPEEATAQWAAATAPAMESIAELAMSGALRVATDPGRLPVPAPRPVPWDRVEGMLLGLAIGDSLGNTSESMRPSERRAQYGEIRDYLPNRYADGRAVGLPSDDTQMAFWTLEQLLDHGRVQPDALAGAFATRRIYGIGSTVRAFLGARRPGATWLEAAQESAGNGALMRIAPVLLPHLLQPTAELWRDAVVAGAVTHNDFASNAACGAFVALLLEALTATPPVPAGFWLNRFAEVAGVLEGTIPRYEPRAPGLSGRKVTMSEFSREVVSGALRRGATVEDACNGWHSGAYLLETVPSALFILERHGNDAEEAIVRAVNDTWDNDTVAAIVGAAVGALHGAEALPRRWQEGLLGRLGADDDGRLFELISQARLAPGGDSDWLQRFFLAAVRKKLCTDTSCTTCGASEFRKGWLSALEVASRHAPGNPGERRRVLAIGLSRVCPGKEAGSLSRFEAAMRLLIVDADRSGMLSPREVKEALRGSWAARVYERMEVHEQAIRAGAVERAKAQEALKAAAEGQKRERQEARKTAKAERDRAWHASHTESEEDRKNDHGANPKHDEKGK